MSKRSRVIRIRRQLLGWLASLAFSGALIWLHYHPVRRVIEMREETEAVLTPHDRILILAPHPDDEIIGCAGIIQKAQAEGVPIRVAFFTYGDNNEWAFFLYRKHPVFFPSGVRRMGLVRHDEAMEAARRLSLAPEQLTFLGYPDFGTLNIWLHHWGSGKPYRSMLTRVTAVPYINALRPGAPYKGDEVLRDLEGILKTFHPTKIFLSHPADYMPDHLALYLFTRVALWDLQRDIRPELYPYLIHHGNWPSPEGLQPQLPLQPPAGLASLIGWQYSPLTADEVKKKVTALKAHATQLTYSKHYLNSFIRSNELFGDFPDVVLYERQAAAATLGAGDDAESAAEPYGLTEQQRTALGGVESRSIRVEGGEIVMTINWKRPMAPTLRASVFVFGYRPDRNFAQMPKIHVQVSHLRHAVFDQRRRISANQVKVERSLRKLTIRIPRSLLGNPDRLLTSVRTYLGAVPIDWVSWRAILLPTIS